MDSPYKAALDSLRAKRFNPKKKARLFSEGTYTARQTGARQEAEKYARDAQGLGNTRDLGKASQDTQSWEDFISGKGGG